jgi:16S rRNA (uracil1498-N3)-methyltransferase
MEPGDDIILLDGTGWEYFAQITHLGKKQVVVRVGKRQKSSAESSLNLTVAQALLKEKKMDRLVRPLTELGIRRLIPFSSKRSVPRPVPHRWEARLRRWERIGREAMKQCRRSRVPDFSSLFSWESLLSSCPEYDLAILFGENARTPLTEIVRDHPPRGVRKLIIILGPEGGFDDNEVATFKSLQVPIATLGPRILRAETAALAAAALSQFLWGDLYRKDQ